MNFVGALLGQEVAHTVSDVIQPPSGNAGLVIVLAGLLGAITWNLITWYFGLPSSSSHALIGGLVGAALAAGAGDLVARGGDEDAAARPADDDALALQFRVGAGDGVGVDD